ncbi:MAG TPA: hypothetical protein VGJ55_17625 [Pyrinomonadaceae bacterium]
MSLNQLLREANIAWHCIHLGEPDWRPCSHSLAFSAELRRERLLLHLILNAYWEPLDYELPAVSGREQDPWRRWIDTAFECPNDIVEWQAAPYVPGYLYRAQARSVVALFASTATNEFTIKLNTRRALWFSMSLFPLIVGQPTR